MQWQATGERQKTDDPLIDEFKLGYLLGTRHPNPTADLGENLSCGLPNRSMLQITV